MLDIKGLSKKFFTDYLKLFERASLLFSVKKKYFTGDENENDLNSFAGEFLISGDENGGLITIRTSDVSLSLAIANETSDLIQAKILNDFKNDIAEKIYLIEERIEANQQYRDNEQKRLFIESKYRLINALSLQHKIAQSISNNEKVEEPDVSILNKMHGLTTENVFAINEIMFLNNYYLRGATTIEAEIDALRKTTINNSFSETENAPTPYTDKDEIVFHKLANRFMERGGLAKAVDPNFDNVVIKQIGHPKLALLMFTMTGLFLGVVAVLIKNLFRNQIS